MRIYIAAPYPLRDEACRVRLFLQARGHEVTSTWLIETDDDGPKAAQIDLDDIVRADVLLALHPDDWHGKGTGGRHVELGYALALGKRIVLVGERSHIFHHLNCIEVISHVADFR